MEKKNIDWSNLGFGYVQTDMRYVSNFKDGAWDEGVLTEDAMVTISECAGVLQYAQTVFEGLKAYTTEDGHIVCFRPDLNADRMKDSAERLIMPAFPKDKFIEAVTKVVAANAEFVPPYGSGARLYLRPYMFGTKLMKRIMQIMLHAYLSKPKGMEASTAFMSCYLLCSNDGVNFKIVTGCERKTQTQDVTFPYFPTCSYRYYMFALTGELESKSMITALEMEVAAAWNGRLR